jgi:hypothetical protein
MSCVKECNVPDVTHNEAFGCYSCYRYLILIIKSKLRTRQQRTEYYYATWTTKTFGHNKRLTRLIYFKKEFAWFNLTEMTNKMQLYRKIYYSIFPRLLHMSRAILSLIIRSIVAGRWWKRPATTNVSKTSSCNYSFKCSWWWTIISLETCWAVKKME